MTATQPTAAQMAAFQGDAHDGPIIMINLLKFKERATYPDDAPEAAEGLSGAEAYDRYAAALETFSTTEDVQLNPICPLTRARAFIGEDGAWDAALVVRYPSRRHFLAMINSDAYQTAHRHREAGLAHQVLIEAPQ